MTTAFVLSGGGSLGAVQVGMLQALGECGVEPDVVAAIAQHLVQRSGYLELRWQENHARVRTPPQDRLTFGKPREDAQPISGQQRGRRQIRACRKQSVRRAQCSFHEGKRSTCLQPRNHTNPIPLAIADLEVPFITT